MLARGQLRCADEREDALVHVNTLLMQAVLEVPEFHEASARMNAAR